MSPACAPEPEGVLRLRGITKRYGALTANEDIGEEAK